MTGYRFARLATYNAEVARGIVHTDEWKARMAFEQEEFDREQRYRMTLPPPRVPGVSWWRRWRQGRNAEINY